jgi:hypothetical protein
MARDFVFIATTGQTDVQVVLPNAEGRPWRYSIDKACQRRFHVACLERRIPWRMRPFDQTDGVRERRNVALELDPAGTRMSSPLKSGSPDFVEHDCAAGVELCAPLLARCCRLIGEGKLGRAAAALLLTTNRRPPDEDPAEPVAVFALVRAELAQALGLPEEAVLEEVFVTERDLYEIDERGQRHLCTAACRRLDDRLRALSAGHPKSLAVVADVAGIPESKPVLAASAAYRFAEVRYLRPTEEGRETPARGRTLVSPAESLTTRAAVARLVRSGGFHEALAVARHVWGARVEEAEPWRRWLGYVVDVLEQTAPPDFHQTLGRHPDSAICRRLLPISQGGPTLAVAFRAENALRRASWSAALRETFTFPEMALLELVNHHLARPGRLCLDWTRNRFYPREAQGLSPQTAALLARDHTGRDRIHLYEFPEVLDHLRRDLPEAARRSLTEFEDALSPVRGYRNVATHACLDESCITDARTQLEQAGIWPAGVPTRFLDSPQARAVLAALGHTDPARVYRELVDAIIQDMDDFSFRPEAAC